MIVGTLEVAINLPWVHSLKEKRMVRRSLIAKIKNKFNVSIAEIDRMDAHKNLILGVCCISNSKPHINSELDEVLNFIYSHTEGVVQDVNMEIF